ncbi:hypothetical protein [Oleiagrimonas sp. MCCC 1A03011]|uniref:hypothetical protein n=1 Tax=Oleiagrimonas sp. MCCC 1A03011 TaxID=1926883 RepID=UPI0011BF7E31|nr:hypothetical protein [Oleiagrimonas sp. MCCC 1A03011]
MFAAVKPIDTASARLTRPDSFSDANTQKTNRDAIHHDEHPFQPPGATGQRTATRILCAALSHHPRESLQPRLHILPGSYTILFILMKR